MLGVTIGIRNDMEVKRFDKIKDHVEIDMERKDGLEVLLTFTALEIAFMYYELRDLQSQVSNTDSLQDVSHCDNDTKDLIEHTKRVIDLIRDKSGIAVKVLGNRVNKKLEQLNSCG